MSYHRKPKKISCPFIGVLEFFTNMLTKNENKIHDINNFNSSDNHLAMMLKRGETIVVMPSLFNYEHIIGEH